MPPVDWLRFVTIFTKVPILTTIPTDHVPVKAWTDEIEKTAEAQLRNTARLPFIFKHVAAMPDVHAGKGATIGTVIATRGAICPAAVGVDVGCGMTAVRTQLPAEAVMEKLGKLRSRIEAAIPLGRDSNKTTSYTARTWKGWKATKDLNVEKALLDRARLQLGSLGGGNHFIEICLDEKKAVWVMLHSGSRNIGKTLAEMHIFRARGLMKELAVKLPDPDLAHFAEGTKDFQNYLRDMHWLQDYAAENREEMMRRVLACLAEEFTEGEPLKTTFQVSCHHNYVAPETHFGERVLVTRKGAVRAGVGDYGIIPGSMGTRSYIVKGLGNPESFHSCSHGAGRRMSRGAAKANISLQEFRKQTEGVECRKDRGVIDEAPGAYKDIDKVMAQQKDLVEVYATLKQVLCVKG